MLSRVAAGAIEITNLQMPLSTKFQVWRGFATQPVPLVQETVGHLLPPVPKKIELHDVLHVSVDTGQPMLLPPDIVTQIKNALHNAKDGKYTKQDLLSLGIKSRYSIIKNGDNFYTVYHGEKKNKLCGKGSTANLKFAQDMETGEWILAKIKFTNDLITPEACRKSAEMEYQILNQLGIALGTFERVSPSKGFQIITLVKFAHGVTLQHYLKFLQHFQRSISIHHALDMTIQLCDALDQLHRVHKIVHQDLKIDNIVNNYAEKQLKLIDYGYSRPLDSNEDYGVQYDFIKTSYILRELWNNVFVTRSAIPTQNRFVQSARDYIKEHMLAPSSLPTAPFLGAKVFFAEVLASMPPNQYLGGLVNPSAYLKENARQEIIDELKKYDLVSIQDDKTVKDSIPVHHYLSLKRELENRGLLVSNTVYLKRDGIFAAKTPQIAAAVEPQKIRKDL